MRSASSIEATPPSATPLDDPPRPPFPIKMGPRGMRITHACDRCRALRVRCSGDPRCSKCTKDQAVCLYSDRKREQSKKSFSDKIDRIRHLEDENNVLAATLRSISQSGSLRPGQHSEVLLLLQTMSGRADERGTVSRSRSMSTTSSMMQQQDDLRESVTGGGEHSASSNVGSPGRKGELNHFPHLNNGSGMVGFIGKMSETSWMRRVHKYLNGSSRGANLASNLMELDTSPEEPTPGLTYFMDEENVLSVDEDYVDHYQLPSRATSLLLSEAFFHAMHGGFPFVLRSRFLDDLPSVMSKSSPSSWADLRQLALCNMVWAVGAIWMQTAQLAQEVSAEHHAVYYARARALGCDHRIQFDHPDLQMLQCMAITAFYLLVNGSVQRAWDLLGQTIRHAISLGLHLRVTSRMIDAEEYETRRCLWLGVYRLETLLVEILGRPTIIQHEDLITNLTSFLPDQESSSPLGDTRDLNPKEDAHSMWMQFLGKDRWAASSFSGPQVPWARFQGIGKGISPSYFPALLRLSQISNAIAAGLFFNQPYQTWYNVQCIIQDLEESLRCWTDNLSDELKIENVGQGNFDPRPNLDLAMYFSSVQMLLYRPCLCEIEIENESASSKEFNTLRARLGVQAALKMIGFLPDSPIAVQTRPILPWWSTLHYICQAGTVLLLEMCLDMQHLQGESPYHLTDALQKVREYLRVLSPHSKSAYKAYQIFRVFMEKVSQRYQGSVFNSSAAEPLMPRNWDESDNNVLMALMKALR